eukprot:CCRYP_017290-RA/>CCRYP_017290-RA protein AED:0.39 eAED:0.32 QI:0/0/0/1/0/0/2/0/90
MTTGWDQKRESEKGPATGHQHCPNIFVQDRWRPFSLRRPVDLIPWTNEKSRRHLGPIAMSQRNKSKPSLNRTHYKNSVLSPDYWGNTPVP